MQLLSDLDALFCRCRSSTTPSMPEAQDIGTAVQAFVRKARTHEALENRVVQRGFGVCLDDKAIEVTG